MRRRLRRHTESGPIRGKAARLTIQRGNRALDGVIPRLRILGRKNKMPAACIILEAGKFLFIHHQVCRGIHRRIGRDVVNDFHNPERLDLIRSPPSAASAGRESVTMNPKSKVASAAFENQRKKNGENMLIFMVTPRHGPQPKEHLGFPAMASGL